MDISVIAIGISVGTLIVLIINVVSSNQRNNVKDNQEYYKDILGRLENLNKDISNRLESQNKDISNRLESQNKDISNRLESQNKDILGRLENLNKDISNRLESQNKDILGRLENQNKDIVGQLESIKSAQRDTDIRLTKIETTLEIIIKEIHEMKQRQNEMARELYSAKQESGFSLERQIVHAMSLERKREIQESASEDVSKHITKDANES